MALEKLLKIENVGRFPKLLPTGDVQFRRLNLVYAQNAHGKTTLAGIVRSLKTGDPAYINERARIGGFAPRVELRVSGTNAVFSNGNWDRIHAEIEIFDSTFVSDNVYAGEHVDPAQRKNLYDVVVGAPAVALARRIDEIDAKGRTTAGEITGSEKKLRAFVQAPFDLAEFVDLRPVPDADVRIAEVTTKLNAVRKSKEVLARREPEQFELPEVPQKVFEVLRTTVEQISKEAEQRVRQHVQLRLDARGEAWLRQGLEYMREGDACPFCTQSTGAVELVALFRKYFSVAYREHVVEIERALNAVDKALGEAALQEVQKKALGNDACIRGWADLAELSYAAVSLTEIEPAWRRIRQLLTAALKEKLANPSVLPSEHVQLDAAARDFVEARNALVDRNVAIRKASDEIAGLKAQSAATGGEDLESQLRRLRNSQIRQQPDVAAVCEQLQRLRQRKKDLEREKKTARADLEKLAQEVLTQYEKTINKVLRDFGANFTITGTKPSFPGGKASSTYQILVNSKPVELGDSSTPRGVPCFRTVLSAGDKSALALAFFLARLRSDALLKDKTIVLDDPLSSLDSFRRSCTQQEIWSLAQNCSQVVVLSHDPFLLKQLYDGFEKAETRALAIERQGNDYFLKAWDIARACRSATHQAYFVLRTFLDSGIPEDTDRRMIAREIRVYVEGSMRHLFPELPEDKWLGDFIRLIRDAPADSRLASWKGRLTELEAVNEYSKGFHHAGEAVEQAVPAEEELRAFSERALRVVLVE